MAFSVGKTTSLTLNENIFETFFLISFFHFRFLLSLFYLSLRRRNPPSCLGDPTTVVTLPFVLPLSQPSVSLLHLENRKPAALPRLSPVFLSSTTPPPCTTVSPLRPTFLYCTHTTCMFVYLSLSVIFSLSISHFLFLFVCVQVICPVFAAPELVLNTA